MARDSKRVQVTLPDNVHIVIEAMCNASGESVTEYCARAVMNKFENDLMTELPDKWRDFAARIEVKPE
jgi:hypothetical protein